MVEWLTGWSYRRPITVTAGSAGMPADFQLRIVINTASLISAGKMRSDGGDIRFTKADGVTLLNYWVESGINTTSTVIWVKDPDALAANASHVIYLYYGNPNATSLSNEDNVFDYVDRGDKIANWTLSGVSGQDTSVGNPAPSYYARSYKGDYMYRNIGLVPGRIVTFNVISNGLGNFYFLVDVNGAGQMYRLDTRGGTDYSGFATTTNWTGWNAPSSGFTASANTWYKFTIIIKSDTQADLYYWQTTDKSPYGFGTLLGTFTISNKGPYIGLVGDNFGTSYKTWWDNIIVRKYVDPEPTYTVGSETAYAELTETTSLSDVRLSMVSVIKSDSLGLSDVRLASIATIKSETLAISDVLSKAIAKAIADSVGVSDVFEMRWSILRELGESVGIQDFVEWLKYFTRVLTETIVLEDIVVHDWQYILGVVRVGDDIVGSYAISYKDWVKDGLPIQTLRHKVADYIYVDDDKVGGLEIEWEDKVTDITEGSRTLYVIGSVELVDEWH